MNDDDMDERVIAYLLQRFMQAVVGSAEYDEYFMAWRFYWVLIHGENCRI